MEVWNQQFSLIKNLFPLYWADKILSAHVRPPPGNSSSSHTFIRGTPAEHSDTSACAASAKWRSVFAAGRGVSAAEPELAAGCSQKRRVIVHKHSGRCTHRGRAAIQFEPHIREEHASWGGTRSNGCPIAPHTRSHSPTAVWEMLTGVVGGVLQKFCFWEEKEKAQEGDILELAILSNKASGSPTNNC